VWARALHRTEHAPTDVRWPAPTFSADFAHGVELYRANMRSRVLHPEARHTDVPVQVVIPLRDRYVTPALLDGLDDWTSELWRYPVDAGHWVIRTNPGLIAAAVREFVAHVDQGNASPTTDVRTGGR
jgi:pimeloyl-ACP methyl ester carboxylesterase